jgi:putative transposase
VDRCQTFSSDDDRLTYLRLLKVHLPQAEVRLLAWCLMTNHVHVIALPERADSLPVLLRRVHGRYAQYYNTRTGRSGHLWQNRFFACALGGGHLWKALAYVERNPVRAHMALWATDYPWSSAAAHVSGADPLGILDLDWWRREGSIADWRDILHGAELEEDIATLRGCTYAGRPFGDERFVKEMSERFGRQWIRGRPKKQGRALSVKDVGRQRAFFSEMSE